MVSGSCLQILQPSVLSVPEGHDFSMQGRFTCCHISMLSNAESLQPVSNSNSLVCSHLQRDRTSEDIQVSELAQAILLMCHIVLEVTRDIHSLLLTSQGRGTSLNLIPHTYIDTGSSPLRRVTHSRLQDQSTAAIV